MAPVAVKYRLIVRFLFEARVVTDYATKVNSKLVAELV